MGQASFLSRIGAALVGTLPVVETVIIIVLLFSSGSTPSHAKVGAIDTVRNATGAVSLDKVLPQHGPIYRIIAEDILTRTCSKVVDSSERETRLLISCAKNRGKIAVCEVSESALRSLTGMISDDPSNTRPGVTIHVRFRHLYPYASDIRRLAIMKSACAQEDNTSPRTGTMCNDHRGLIDYLVESAIDEQTSISRPSIRCAIQDRSQDRNYELVCSATINLLLTVDDNTKFLCGLMGRTYRPRPIWTLERERGWGVGELGAQSQMFTLKEPSIAAEAKDLVELDSVIREYM